MSNENAPVNPEEIINLIQGYDRQLNIFQICLSDRILNSDEIGDDCGAMELVESTLDFLKKFSNLLGNTSVPIAQVTEHLPTVTEVIRVFIKVNYFTHSELEHAKKTFQKNNKQSPNQQPCRASVNTSWRR